MSDNALVHVTTQALAPQGGLGIDFSNPLFGLTPATLSINQRMTQAEGAIPGKFRISETGDQFDTMEVVLLQMPTKERQWYQGEPGQMNRTPDNLMCFSHDCVTPHIKAKVPQSMNCANCTRSSWVPWRKKFEETGIKDNLLIPPCDEFYKALLIDTQYKLPLRMFIRGGENKDAFEKGMKELARKFRLMQSQGHTPNIFDIRFTMKIVTGKKKTNYVLAIDGKSFRMVTPEEKAEFGGVYQQFAAQGQKATTQAAEQEARNQIQDESDIIDAEVIQPGTGEIEV